MDRDPRCARRLIDDALDALATATSELRELARGIHPAVLTEGGLEPAISGLAARVSVPVEIEGPPQERLAADIEATAYFLIAGALTNNVRHADARDY